MQIWGITIKPIIFAVVAVSVVVIGAITFKQLQNRSFVPQQIEQQQLDQSRSQLSAAQDLEGTWQGAAIYQPLPGNVCTFQDLMSIVINTQTNTTIVGTVSLINQKAYWGKKDCPQQNKPAWSPPVPFSADMSGSRLTNINLGTFNDFGEYSGSFTTDTMTINQVAEHQSQGSTVQFKSPINLLRQ